MPFSPPIPSLRANQSWTNQIYDDFVSYCRVRFRGLGANEFAAPITLDRARQNLHGGFNSIYRFARWLGPANTTDRVVRDVCGYGAVGDGVHDDRAAIQAAIDDIVNDSGGGVVLLPPGTYYITDAIRLSGTAGTFDEVALCGFGESSVIKMGDAFAGYAAIVLGATGTTASGQRVSSLRIQGNSTNNPSATIGIAIGRTLRSAISQVTIEDLNGIAMRCERAIGLSIEGCRILNLAGTAAGIYLYAGSTLEPTDNVVIADCLIEGGFTYGVNIDGACGAILACNQIRNGAAVSTGVRIHTTTTVPSVKSPVLFANQITGCQDGVSVEING